METKDKYFLVQVLTSFFILIFSAIMIYISRNDYSITYYTSLITMIIGIWIPSPINTVNEETLIGSMAIIFNDLRNLKKTLNKNLMTRNQLKRYKIYSK